MSRIADEYEILRALKRVLKGHKVIVSQRKLKGIISHFLEEKSVGEKRLRMIAIDNKLVKVKIFTRESKEDFKSDRCPVCGAKIFVTKDKDIWGNPSKIEYRCKRCGYRSGIKKKIPTKYVFYSKI